MCIIDKLERKFFPTHLAKKNVDKILGELENRERVGDAKLHQQLDSLNQKAGAFDKDTLVDAYQSGMSESYAGAELSKVRDAVAKKQEGFALSIATVAMADGHLDDSEKQAIADIADQHYEKYGNCGAQPLLAYGEALDLRTFAQAPNDVVRSWMVEHGNQEYLELPAAEQLGELLFSDGSLDVKGRDFVVQANSAFNAVLTGPANFFLTALDGTDVDLRPRGDKYTSPSLRENAHNADTPPYPEDDTQPWVDVARPGACEMALLKGATFAANHQAGLADSAEARSLFPKR